MPTTAAALTNAARDLLLAHPHLGVDRAYQMALEANPQLARDHHAGIAGEATPAPAASTPTIPNEPELVDPGVLLMQHAAVAGISFAEAAKALPALGAAYHRGELVPKPGLGTNRARGYLGVTSATATGRNPSNSADFRR